MNPIILPPLPGATGPALFPDFCPALPAGLRAALLRASGAGLAAAFCLALLAAPQAWAAPAQAGQTGQIAQMAQSPGPEQKAPAPEDSSFVDDLFTGQEWQAKGNLRAARQAMQDALDREPGNSFARIRLAQIDAAAGDLKSAGDGLAQVLRQDPDNLLALLWQGHILMGLDRPDEAQASYERVLKLDPENGWALAGSAVCSLAKGKDKEAGALLSQAQTQAGAGAGEDPDLHLVLGDTFARLNLLTNARLELERSLELNPRGVRALVLAGVVYERLGNEGLALNAWSQALGLDPTSGQARADMLAVLGRQAEQAVAAGNPAEAMRLWRTMLSYDPRNQQALDNLRRPMPPQPAAAASPQPGPTAPAAAP
jgi:tetratricopeptide (TPR) repeat protein